MKFKITGWLGDQAVQLAVEVEDAPPEVEMKDLRVGPVERRSPDRKASVDLGRRASDVVDGFGNNPYDLGER